MTTSILYYVHDPMCSWCWAFRPAWQAVVDGLPADVQTQRVLGGLAEDSDQPMPEAMQVQLQDTWKRIQKRLPECSFNFDFWTLAAPRRSTWPACRAVLAAAQQDAEETMISAIQQAYYLQARNPSDNDVLIALAEEAGLDRVQFAADLHSDAVHQALQDQMALSAALGVSSFPSLVLDMNGSRWPVSVDYDSPDDILQQVSLIREMSDSA